MKAFLRIVFIVAFVLIVPNFLGLLSLKLSGLSAESIKTKLAQEGVYGQILKDVNKGVEQPLPIGPAYLQSKIEKLIDDTELWVKGRTPQPPIISLNDLNPKILEQSRSAAKEMKNQNGTNQFDLNKFVQNGFEIPVGQNLIFLKNIYKWIMLLPLVGLVLAALIVGIFATSNSSDEGFRSLGWTFLISGFFALVGWAIAFLGNKALDRILTESSLNLPTFLTPTVNIFVRPIMEKHVQISGVAIFSLFVLGILSFVAAKNHFLSNK